MEHSEIINLWKTYDEKLEKVLAINKQNTQELLRLKAKNLISEMRPYKSFTLFVGLVWVILGVTIVSNLFVNALDKISWFFLISASLQLLLTAVATGIYIYQLIMINQINITESVVETQKKLSYLKGTTLWVTKILFLQLPLWTTFYLSSSMLMSGDIAYILINGIVTAVFTFAAIWLFININYQNKDKKWFKLIFDGKEWTPIMESIEFYKEIEGYEKP